MEGMKFQCDIFNKDKTCHYPGMCWAVGVGKKCCLVLARRVSGSVSGCWTSSLWTWQGPAIEWQMQDLGWILAPILRILGPACPDCFQAISQAWPSSRSWPSFADIQPSVGIMLLASKRPSKNALALAHYKERGNALWNLYILRKHYK